jgi:hypothetical protein
MRGMSDRLFQRLHNPSGRVCGCSSECVCQRTRVGRLLRWYIPRGFHKSVPPEFKRSAEFRKRFR